MQLLEDPSPLVRGMAVWAIAALGGIDQLTSYRSLAAGETDAEVCREWNRVGIAP
jgi:epoxyqueuosine reductase